MLSVILKISKSKTIHINVLYRPPTIDFYIFASEFVNLINDTDLLVSLLLSNIYLFLLISPVILLIISSLLHIIFFYPPLAGHYWLITIRFYLNLICQLNLFLKYLKVFGKFLIFCFTSDICNLLVMYLTQNWIPLKVYYWQTSLYTMTNMLLSLQLWSVQITILGTLKIRNKKCI